MFVCPHKRVQMCCSTYQPGVRSPGFLLVAPLWWLLRGQIPSERVAVQPLHNAAHAHRLVSVCIVHWCVWDDTCETQREQRREGTGRRGTQKPLLTSSSAPSSVPLPFFVRSAAVFLFSCPTQMAMICWTQSRPCCFCVFLAWSLAVGGRLFGRTWMHAQTQTRIGLLSTPLHHAPRCSPRSTAPTEAASAAAARLLYVCVELYAFMRG